MRSASLPETAELVKDFRGMDNLKDIFKYRHPDIMLLYSKNSKTYKDKPFLGTRKKSLNEKGETGKLSTPIIEV